ncbi:LacI family DNA-binding transcriptional regulator [Micromonospora sp. NPDC007230]|uniref:LacI family DNA-binding transcriptional regulator n=1 Tax=Micromonospora sp. NPDC007230 TaxID=3364237 RepID=UPI00368AB7AB
MVSIADVARAAGVSPSTVSYVLSGRRSISAATRARVEASIAELGYRPHAGARALARRHTNVLALVAPLRADINVPVIMKFVTSVVTAARSYDHDVLLLTKDEGTAGLERVAGSAMVDALIVMDVEADDVRVPVLSRLRQPAVLIGLPHRPAGISCVDLDWAATGYAAVQHLAEHGHRSVALVGPPPVVYQRGTGYAERFLSGFTDAVAHFGLASVAHACEPTFDGAAECLRRVDAELPDATALVVHNEAALGSVLGILHAAGRRVPDDVSVLAICPDDVALGLPVRLTTVDIPADEVGALAVEMLMNLLDGRHGAQTRLLAPVLTERDSCGPPRPRHPDPCRSQLGMPLGGGPEGGVPSGPPDGGAPPPAGVVVVSTPTTRETP